MPLRTWNCQLSCALTCFKCDLLNATGVCERGESSCQARGSQQCFLRKVYEGDRFQHGYQDCRDLCIPMSVFKPNLRVDVECCRGESFCNRV
ncbi:protein PIP-1-like [Eptesicus fuscus]|uniref:protein PIP-1-like n=1 Tax=Eptesicus fuscus TaxID=29078 RepID=UPI002403D9EE|nr:protein PIP-1-like [Eptesicus fuscus]